MRSLGAVTVVLAYGALLVVLHPRALAFDGLAFLMAARAGALDYGHALYLPLLNLGGALAGGAASERVAQVVSALGGASTLALLLRRFERAGVPPGRALLVAVCFGVSTLVWQEGGSVEPTTWTLATLLLAAEAAEAYARRPSAARLGAAMLAFAAAVGFHLVSLCALPWLASRARRAGAAPPARHLLFLLAGALLVVLLAWLGGNLFVYLRFWSGFVPDFRNGVWAELEWHLQRAGRLFLEGAPVLLALAGLGGFALRRERARGVEEALLLAVPYLGAYLLLGKPLVGLLMPVLLAGALLVGSAALLGDEAQVGRVPRVPAGAIVLVLAFSAALQFSLSLPQALVWHREPDANRARAELFARHTPEGTRLLAGPLSNHLRYYWPALDVLSLPELWHARHAEDRSADPIEVVRQAVESSGKRCLLSSDGAGFLLGLGADLTRLGLTLESALPVPEDPRLSLFPLGE